MEDIGEFLRRLPKAELHLHIEGTIAPAKVLSLAMRNGIDLPYTTEAELLAAQDYGPPVLENFLHYHYMCTDVLRTGRDLFEIATTFLDKCVVENIRHVELSFDPQPHIARGIEFDAVVDALVSACRIAEKRDDLSTVLIMCMNRDRTEESALHMLDQAARHRRHITGVGLDSFEEDNPPIKFQEFYRRAREEGYRLTAHCDCDQKDSVEHIRQCLHVLGVERIDHGLHCLDDSELLQEVVQRGIGLTMCPTWRPSDPQPRRLKALREMLDRGVAVSLNTDDPEEFSSRYLTNTVVEVQRAGNFSAAEMVQFMRNAFSTAWIDGARRTRYLAELDEFRERWLGKSQISREAEK